MESPDPHGHPRGGSVTVRPDSALASPGDVDSGLSGSVLRDASEIQPSLEIWCSTVRRHTPRVPVPNVNHALSPCPLVGQTPTGSEVEVIELARRLHPLGHKPGTYHPNQGPNQQNDHEPRTHTPSLLRRTIPAWRRSPQTSLLATPIVIGAPPHPAKSVPWAWCESPGVHDEGPREGGPCACWDELDLSATPTASSVPRYFRALQRASAAAGSPSKK